MSHRTSPLPVLVAPFLTAASAAAQEPSDLLPVPRSVGAGTGPVAAVMVAGPRDTHTPGAANAATLVGAGFLSPAAPLTELALLRGGDHAECWTLVNTDLARPIPPQFL